MLFYIAERGKYCTACEMNNSIVATVSLRRMSTLAGQCGYYLIYSVTMLQHVTDYTAHQIVTMVIV